jgi:hypothetical protein
MIDLLANPEAVYDLKAGDQVKVGRVGLYVEHFDCEGHELHGCIYLTVIGSRVSEYNNLCMSADTSERYPQYKKYITHLRHPTFPCLMTRDEMVEILKAGTYRIE